MSDTDPQPPPASADEPEGSSGREGEGRHEGGVADALRTAVERTMKATAGSAASTRERAAELVDEVVRRGLDTRDQLARRGQEAGAGLARRGQEAGAELARRGQEATGEVGRRIEQLERRLAELETKLAEERSRTEAAASREPQGEVEPDAPPDSKSKPEAEG